MESGESGITGIGREVCSFCPQGLFVFHFMRKKGPERLCYRRKLMKKFGSLREGTKEDDEPFRKEGSIVLKHKKMSEFKKDVETKSCKGTISESRHLSREGEPS